MAKKVSKKEKIEPLEIMLYTQQEVNFIKEVCNSLLMKGYHYNFNDTDEFVTFTKEKNPESILITTSDNMLKYYHRYMTCNVPNSSRKMFVNESAGQILSILEEYYFNLEGVYRI